MMTLTRSHHLGRFITFGPDPDLELQRLLADVVELICELGLTLKLKKNANRSALFRLLTGGRESQASNLSSLVLSSRSSRSPEPRWTTRRSLRFTRPLPSRAPMRQCTGARRHRGDQRIPQKESCSRQLSRKTRLLAATRSRTRFSDGDRHAASIQKRASH